jgi:hypothetical protein
MQQVVLRRTASLQHATTYRYSLNTQDLVTVEPDLTHICAWTRPHLHCDSPTSEVGHPHICAGTTCGRDHCCEKDYGCAAPHACDGRRAHAWFMFETLAVFQLPMFWLNAFAE